LNSVALNWPLDLAVPLLLVGRPDEVIELCFRSAAIDGRILSLWVDTVEKVVELIVES